MHDTAESIHHWRECKTTRLCFLLPRHCKRKCASSKLVCVARTPQTGGFYCDYTHHRSIRQTRAKSIHSPIKRFSNRTASSAKLASPQVSELIQDVVYNLSWRWELRSDLAALTDSACVCVFCRCETTECRIPASTGLSWHCCREERSRTASA